jgi:hypothetical protein
MATTNPCAFLSKSKHGKECKSSLTQLRIKSGQRSATKRIKFHNSYNSIHWKVGAFSSSHQLHLTSLSPYFKMCENCGSFARKKKLD